MSAGHKTLGDMIADIKAAEAAPPTLDDICTELAVCAMNAASMGDQPSANRIKAQIMRLRTLAATSGIGAAK